MTYHSASLSLAAQFTTPACNAKICHALPGDAFAEHLSFAAVATVKLRTPITLQGAQRLEIFGTATDKPMISVGASDPAGTEICEFHGTSAIGCIADDTDVSLTKTPGGDLGTLLVVVGKGKVQSY
jgi:hypothetical protein